jgi:solute carrier family 25 (mitochondrial phosphate transporter), member 3
VRHCSVFLTILIITSLLSTQTVNGLDSESIAGKVEKQHFVDRESTTDQTEMIPSPSIAQSGDISLYQIIPTKKDERFLASSSALHTPLLPYYGACYLAGAASSSIRWVMNPLELVKVRMQIAKNEYPTIMQGFRVIVQESGFRGLFQGLGPTAIAYMFQTGTKYGTYEVFKDIVIPNIVSEEITKKYPGLVYVVASASAEAVADILMCPWEMLKVKIQTAGVAAISTTSTTKALLPAFPVSTVGGLLHMVKYRKEYNFPFGSLGPLWMRQIPGTVINFYTFENVSKFIFENILGRKQLVKKRKSEYPISTQFTVTLVAGYISGFLSSIVSHPADSIVSLMNQPKYKHSSILQIIQDVGFGKLALQGLGPRIIVTSKIICFQWIMYDFFKSLLLGSNASKIA